MMRLSEKDRDAILLRFFKQKHFKEVGLDLGITEEAARKRIARALEVLRKALAKRDVAIPSALLVGLLSTKSVSASSVGTAALASGALKTPLLATATLALVKGTIKTMAWTKLKATVVGGAALLLVAGSVTITLTQRHFDGSRKLHLDEIWRAETASNNSDAATT